MIRTFYTGIAKEVLTAVNAEGLLVKLTSYRTVYFSLYYSLLNAIKVTMSFWVHHAANQNQAPIHRRNSIFVQNYER